jgi:hypothetical protein
MLHAVLAFARVLAGHATCYLLGHGQVLTLQNRIRHISRTLPVLRFVETGDNL